MEPLNTKLSDFEDLKVGVNTPCGLAVPLN